MSNQQFTNQHQRLRSSSACLIIAVGLTLSMLSLTDGARAAVVAAGHHASTPAMHLSLASSAMQKPMPVDPTERQPTEKPPGKGQPKSSEPKRQKGTVVRGTPQPVAPRTYEVNIKTDVPDADIMQVLGMTRKPLGKTDAEGKLTVRLPRGRHIITASRQGLPYQKHQIEVGPMTNTFSFTLEQPRVSTSANEPQETAPTTTDETSTETTSNGALAENTTTSVGDVTGRYLNIAETERVKHSDWEFVLKSANEGLAKEPESASFKALKLFAQGQIAYLGGNYPDAVANFNHALLAQPDQVMIHYALGNAYLATRQPREALKAYQKAVKLDPELALAHKGIGDALTQLNKKKDAQKSYDKAKSLSAGATAQTTDATSAAAPASATTTTALNLNVVYGLLNRQRWAEALKELQELVRTHPTADVYIAIGDCYVGLKQPFSAAPAYKRAMELDPQSALAFYRYGTLSYEANEYADAMEALERAIALDQTGATINRKRAREMADRARERLSKIK